MIKLLFYYLFINGIIIFWPAEVSAFTNILVGVPVVCVVVFTFTVWFTNSNPKSWANFFKPSSLIVVLAPFVVIVKYKVSGDFAMLVPSAPVNVYEPPYGNDKPSNSDNNACVPSFSDVRWPSPNITGFSSFVTWLFVCPWIFVTLSIGYSELFV